MLKIVGAGLLLAFTSSVLSAMGFKCGRVLSVLGFLLLLTSVGDGISQLIKPVLGMCDTVGISEAAKCALKVVGMGYLFGICSEVTGELGEPLVAKGLLTAGRIEMLLIAAPYFTGIFKLGAELIK